MENIQPKMKFVDIYRDETCSNKEFCSKDKAFYEIPDASMDHSIRNEERTSRVSDCFISGNIRNPNPSNWPGEMGEPYLPPSHLQEESKKRFAENMFDIVVSDQIALNRAMPDIRNDQLDSFSSI